jgi:hypothetical protein
LSSAIDDFGDCDAVFLFTTEPLSSLSPDGVFEGLERHCTASINGFGFCDAVFLFTTEPLSSLSPDGGF